MPGAWLSVMATQRKVTKDGDGDDSKQMRGGGKIE